MPKAIAAVGDHAVVIPLFGALPDGLAAQVEDFVAKGFHVVLVDNRSKEDSATEPIHKLITAAAVVENHNRGGVAGGFNRGIAKAVHDGAKIVTLLDQDSALSEEALQILSAALQATKGRVVVGPRVVDQWRVDGQKTNRSTERAGGAVRRMLISSGTTFRSCDWDLLGSMHEALEVDYVDHYWCYRAQQNGFAFHEESRVVLWQRFGEKHPSALCHWLGLQLYSPARHYTSLRNLRWMLKQPCVPLDFKLKEVIKMMVKPWLWLMMEPKRGANLGALLEGLLGPLPSNDPSR